MFSWKFLLIFVCFSPGMSCCPERCSCEGKNITCRGLNDNYTSLLLPNDTQSLDLSDAGLQRVPSELFRGLTQLKSLSLAYNYLTAVYVQDFKELLNLQFLNLSYNTHLFWKGAINQSDIPSLTTIDITGNPQWLPTRLLAIPWITTIHGASWSPDCTNCDLTRHWFEIPSPRPTGCNQAARFYFQQFTSPCNHREGCRMSCVPPGASSSPTPAVSKMEAKQQLAFISGYFIGSLALVVNLIVIINVIMSKALKRDVTMVIIANMALCDILIAIHSIIMSKYNIYVMVKNVDWIQHGTLQHSFPYCRLATVAMTTGEIVSVVSSLLLTIERYTCIVHCMSPDVRLRKRHVIVVITTMWLASLLFSLSPLYGFLSLQYSPSMTCTMPTNQNASRPSFLIYPCAMIFFNYVVMVPMYIRIFMVASRSNIDVNICRNASLARKVLFLIGSNCVLFAVPMSLIVVYAVKFQGHSITLADRPISFFIFFELFPIMLLSLNSFLNPFLYAFRHRKFQREFKAKFNIAFRGGLVVELHRAYTNATIQSPTAKTDCYDLKLSQRDSGQTAPVETIAVKSNQ